jgi:hypothetical protein
VLQYPGGLLGAAAWLMCEPVHRQKPLRGINVNHVHWMRRNGAARGGKLSRFISIDVRRIAWI